MRISKAGAIKFLSFLDRNRAMRRHSNKHGLSTGHRTVMMDSHSESIFLRDREEGNGWVWTPRVLNRNLELWTGFADWLSRQLCFTKLVRISKSIDGIIDVGRFGLEVVCCMCRRNPQDGRSELITVTESVCAGRYVFPLWHY